MNPAQWQRITPLFHGALAQTPQGRAAFLDAACGTDSFVRERVERLLMAHDHAEVLEHGAIDADDLVRPARTAHEREQRASR
jgi:hypothetical protein